MFESELLNLLLITFVAALIADISMIFGVLPFFFVQDMPKRVSGVFSAAAGGMMISASLIQLVGEGLERAPGFGVLEVAGGLVVGAAMYAGAARWIKAHEEFDILHLRKSGGANALLIVAAMTVHSLPEGISIGVAFGSQDRALGFAVVSALAVHNIPEAIAITLALRAGGVSVWKCIPWVLLTSIPQPLAAPFAAWFIWLFEPLLPFGMGLAAGAMTFLVFDDLLPESLKKVSPMAAASGCLVGIAAMMVLGRAVGL